jgi:two-component system, NarL family, sensor histidine kinase UhpB
LVWFVINIIVLGILYYVLGRVLEPLSGLARGLLKLEDGHYATRLDKPEVEEFALIANRFNTLAEALEIARDENSRLYRQLIAVQEEERRELANELHDEAGPCLFGITANAASVQKLALQIDDSRTRELSARVGEILSITERLKLMNRALLKRLRPGALGRVSLADLLSELIAGFQGRHPGTNVLRSLGKLDRSYGEAIDLALYRAIQEGMTNAIRHGQPQNVFIELTQEENAQGESALELTIRDDGQGMAPSTPRGFGLAAMRERVRSLGGSCVVESAPGMGTTVRIVIPFNLPEQKQAKQRAKAGTIPGETVT